MQECIEEIVQIKENRRSMKWMTEGIINLMGNRRGAKQNHNVENYKELDEAGVCMQKKNGLVIDARK